MRVEDGEREDEVVKNFVRVRCRERLCGRAMVFPGALINGADDGGACRGEDVCALARTKRRESQSLKRSLLFVSSSL